MWGRIFRPKTTEDYNDMARTGLALREIAVMGKWAAGTVLRSLGGGGKRPAGVASMCLPKLYLHREFICRDVSEAGSACPVLRWSLRYLLQIPAAAPHVVDLRFPGSCHKTAREGHVTCIVVFDPQSILSSPNFALTRILQESQEHHSPPITVEPGQGYVLYPVQQGTM